MVYLLIFIEVISLFGFCHFIWVSTSFFRWICDSLVSNLLSFSKLTFMCFFALPWIRELIRLWFGEVFGYPWAIILHFLLSWRKDLVGILLFLNTIYCIIAIGWDICWLWMPHILFEGCGIILIICCLLYFTTDHFKSLLSFILTHHFDLIVSLGIGDTDAHGVISYCDNYIYAVIVMLDYWLNN